MQRRQGGGRPRSLFGLTTLAQVGEHLRQLALERRTRQPVRYITRWVDSGAIAQQCTGAVIGGFELPQAVVLFEVARDLTERDALVRHEIGAERPPEARRVPSEIDLLVDELRAAVPGSIAHAA